MKKIITYILLASIIFSCSDSSEKKENIYSDSLMPVEASLAKLTENQKDSIKNNSLDTASYLLKKDKDSVMTRINDLIKSTDNSDKKICQIKAIKTENQSLKKEIKDTKQELKNAKDKIKKLDSVIMINEKKEKGFFRKVIDNIKGVKDSTNSDDVKE